jgi:hypothetical protein
VPLTEAIGIGECRGEARTVKILPQVTTIDDMEKPFADLKGGSSETVKNSINVE